MYVCIKTASACFKSYMDGVWKLLVFDVHLVRLRGHQYFYICHMFYVSCTPKIEVIEQIVQ